MNFDRDLADALRPLAGDPVADAARVLAALPAAPAEPPPRARHAPWTHWLPWTLLLVGALVGIGIDRLLTPGSSAPAAPPEVKDAEPPPPTPDMAPNQGFLSGPSKSDHQLLVMAFGPLDIDEPGLGVQHLEEGQWQTALGTSFKTANSQVGLYTYANDARVRLDRNCEASIDVDRVTLDFGRIWIDTGQRDATIRVICGGTRVTFVDSSGTLARVPSGVEIVALRGSIDVVTPLDTVRVAAHERLQVDANGAPQAAVKVPLLASATSWMTRMIEESTDRRELTDRVREVFDAYEQDTARDEARRELLKLGARCVWLLADSIDRRLADDRAYALDATQVLAAIVDYRTATFALPLLLQDDAELRELVFRAVARATGTDGATDAPFWRDAPREQRLAAIDRWRNQLLR